MPEDSIPITAKTREDFDKIDNLFQQLPVSIKTYLVGGKLGSSFDSNAIFFTLKFIGNDSNIIRFPNSHCLKEIRKEENLFCILCRVGDLTVCYQITNPVPDQFRFFFD